MAESKGNRFTQYFTPLLDALRSKDPEPMRPSEAIAWVRAQVDVPAEDLTRRTKNGAQSIFEKDVNFVRFHLFKAGLIGAPKRGLWGLTEEGRDTHLTPDEAWALYLSRTNDGSDPGALTEDEDAPAPETADDGDEYGPSYWFVGAVWDKKYDQMSRFIEAGIWENGYAEVYSDHTSRMNAGDRIAIKASFARMLSPPFDSGGKPVCGMRIRATGMILENLKDGKTVKVAWDPPFEPRDWYFYIFVAPVAKADAESEDARRLIDFTFGRVPQDYGWFLEQPYWVEKFGTKSAERGSKPAPETSGVGEKEPNEIGDEPTYSSANIIDDGCFLSIEELDEILLRWRSKKNLVLQGPPGTGKTWLAKRLGFALVGSNDRETARSRLRVVQFHPSLSYEDFVRGWRPSADGKLALVDGILMQAIDAAASEDRPFVLVIEEINRGNPAQIFGEMLTLLEDTKRRRSEAIELAYRKAPGERIYVPKNLYVIGTMNVADRSLAIVDLAFRRRFAFVDLEPRLGAPWRSWCARRGLDDAMLTEIEARIAVLNADIASAVSLGPQFRIGHSYVTPDADERVPDSRAWFRAKVETEIGPLLDEYWYDAIEKAKGARGKLLAGLT